MAAIPCIGMHTQNRIAKVSKGYTACLQASVVHFFPHTVSEVQDFPFFCNNQQEEAQERKNGEWKVISAGKSIFTMERGNLSDKRASPNPVYNGWNLKQKKYAGFNSSRSTHR